MNDLSKRRKKSVSARSSYGASRSPLDARFGIVGTMTRSHLSGNIFSTRLRRSEPRTWTGNPIHSPLMADILPLSCERVMATFQSEPTICIYSATDASLHDAPNGSYRQLKRLDVDVNSVFAVGRESIDVFDLEKEAWTSLAFDTVSFAADVASDGETYAYLTIPQLSSTVSIVGGDRRCAQKGKPSFVVPVNNPSMTTYAAARFLGDDSLKFAICSIEGEVMVCDLRMPENRPVNHRALTGAPLAPRWNEETRQILPGYSRHTAPIVDFSPTRDGKRVVTTSSNGVLKIWSTSDFSCLGTATQVDHAIHPVITPDGDIAYFWSEEAQTIVELSLESCEIQHTFQRPSSRSAVCLGLSHESGIVDGLFVGNISGRITVYNYRDCD